MFGLLEYFSYIKSGLRRTYYLDYKYKDFCLGLMILLP